MTDKKSAVIDPVQELAQIESEVMAVNLIAITLDAFNYVFAYRQRAQIAVKGSRKMNELRENFANDFFSTAIRKDALAIAKRQYAVANNVGPKDMEDVTDRQLWSFISGL